MTTVEYLKQAYRLDELINSDLRELERLRRLATSLSGVKLEEKVSGNTQQDRISLIISRIVDLENKINGEIDEYIDLKEEIRGVIEKVQDRNEQLVLRLRYMGFLTWQEISQEMNYSIKQAKRIHKSALENIEVPKHVPKCP